MSIAYRNRSILLLLLIVVVGSVFRLYRLNEVPYEMHRDELAIAYNAYSISQTGMDEHGAGPYPLFFRSFGDNKLPGSIYLTSLVYKFIPPSVFSARLMTVFFSIMLIPIVYWFVTTLGLSTSVGLWASFLLAICQWHVYLSRTIYEPVFSLPLFFLALIALLKSKDNRRWLVVFGVSYIFSLFIYNTPMLLMPPILLWFLYLYRKQIGSWIDKLGLVLIVLLSIGVSLYLLKPLVEGRAHSTIFQSEEIIRQANEERVVFFLSEFNPLVSRVLTHPYMGSVRRFVRGYTGAVNPIFLFSEGDSNPWHTLSFLQMGSFSLLMGVGMLYGMVYVLKSALEKKLLYVFLTGLILISPLASSLTYSSPSTNRLLEFYTLLTVLAGIGVSVMVSKLQKQYSSYYLWILFVVLFLGHFIVFYTRYQLLHSHFAPSEWRAGMRDVAAFLRTNSNDFQIWVDTEGPVNQIPTAYIRFAFYNLTDPKLIQRSVRVKTSGFDHVLQMGNYSFVHLNELLRSETSPIIEDDLMITQSVYTDLEKVYTAETITSQPLWNVYQLPKQD